MDFENSRWRYGLYIIQAVAAAAGVVSLIGESLQGKLNWVLIAVLGVLVVSQVVLYVLSRPPGRQSLVEGTKRFTKFFTRWYSQEGQLVVYCDELRWLEHPQHAPIVDALRQKAEQRNLKIFVRKPQSDICTQLRRAGAHVRTIPVETFTRASMSLHTIDGTETLIIRYKKHDVRAERHRVRFKETRDYHFIALARDLFRVLDS